jgi:hypothetical protein
MPKSLLLSVALLAACTPQADNENLGPELDEGPPLGKEDNAGVPGLPVSGDYSATRAWSTINNWEDRDTVEANKAGLAWGENSGLDWDQKYALWIQSLPKIPAIQDSSWGPDTIQITTPFGKTLPAPKLDCADVALLLRYSFAAWYRLPIYLVGYDGARAVYFGHFGIRTSTGPWSKAPKFGALYSDYSNQTPDQYTANWPHDSGLRTQGVEAGDDLPFLGPGARVGTWLDEVHLNKKAARLIVYVMNYLGSANFADARNTYNLTPEALRAGDFLLYRRGTHRDGHTMPVVRVTDQGDGHMSAETVFGNEPPMQPAWQGPDATHYEFTNDEGGGPSMNPDGEIYSHLGGGLKRFRVAKQQSGRWINTWMTADSSSWIDSTDYEKIAARPAEFDSLLGQNTPEQQRDLLLSVIEQKRARLRQLPSSCSARDGREQAFAQLYTLEAEQFGLTQAEVDKQYRVLDDYIFAPLDAARSRTCCWDSSTPAMYQIIVDYVNSLQQDSCVAPPVFASVGGQYQAFADFAASVGRAGDWRSWSQDEPCAQAGNLDDTLETQKATPWCGLQ